VLEVGPAEGLGPAEFRLGESGCAGDSGGPAFAEDTGAVLGVLSRGSNGTNAPAGTAEGCLDAENVFTSAATYKELILSAYAKAGQEPWLEGQPDPTTLPPKPPPVEESGSGCAIASSRPGRGLRGGSSLAPWALLAGAIAACAARRVPRSCPA
jgi:hypothetical protein